MRIFASLKAGFLSTARSWRGLTIIWFLSLLLVGLVAIPMKSALKAGLGNSMITEKLADGINIDVFADMGANLISFISYFSGGVLMVIIVGFIMNSFLTGGLFNSLKGSSGQYSITAFFGASAKNFWSFIVISLILSLFVLSLIIMIVVIPISIVSQAEITTEETVFKTSIIALSVLLFILPVLLLVADYARAWQVSNEKNACIKAISFGFSQTFRTFFSSYPLMLILLIIQLLYGWLVINILPELKPVSGGGIVLLFLLSQLLFFVKLLLKAWRYGSVTRMMEMNFCPPTPLNRG